MTTLHTAGTWKAYRTDETNKRLPVTVSMDDGNEAKIFGDNNEANARLIAAAPELLEAVLHLPKHLIEVADILTNHAAKNGSASVYDKVLKLVAADLQTIIAKATGEPVTQ
jgi:hypothetical protein